MKEKKRFVVLSGSPKGKDSVTLQYVRYLFNKKPDYEIEVFHIGKRIYLLEKDMREFDKIMETIKSAEGIIWTFPVYYMLVPFQLKRFIELIFENSKEAIFKDKYACAVMTSIHFFDHTASNYIHSVSEDLKMNYIASHSVDMRALTTKEGRKRIEAFGEKFFTSVEKRESVVNKYNKIVNKKASYTPEKTNEKVEFQEKRILIIADSLANDTLKKMVQKFSSLCNGKVEIVVLENLDMKGGCLGCIRCAYDNTCVYKGKDDFIAFYETKVKAADIVIFAGEIKDRYLSSTWKKYFDRSFYNTHIPSLIDKHVGMLISGPLEQLPNVRQIFEAYFQVQQVHFHGFVTEVDDNKLMDQQLRKLAESIKVGLSYDFKPQKTFLGISAYKMFRDEIYGSLRFPFRADYKAYKKLGIFDFPQKKYRRRISNAFMRLLVKIPPIRKEIYEKKMIPVMVENIRKIADQAKLNE